MFLLSRQAFFFFLKKKKQKKPCAALGHQPRFGTSLAGDRIARLASFEEAINSNYIALLGAGTIPRPAPPSTATTAPLSGDAKLVAPAAAAIPVRHVARAETLCLADLSWQTEIGFQLFLKPPSLCETLCKISNCVH